MVRAASRKPRKGSKAKRCNRGDADSEDAPTHRDAGLLPAASTGLSWSQALLQVRGSLPPREPLSSAGGYLWVLADGT